MLGWRRSGLSPWPSAGTIASWVNGDSKNASRVAKNTTMPSSTAVAYGTTSRRRLRVRNSTSEDHRLSSQTQRSSEPSCDDHAAAPL
jgi:hypothetical protein